MIVAVFRSYARPEHEAEYREAAQCVAQVAKTIPVYISHKSLMADDGERLTLVEYASEEALRTWSRHPEHVQAKRFGRQKFYASYKVQILSLLHEHASRPRPATGVELSPAYPSQALRREELTAPLNEPDPRDS